MRVEPRALLKAADRLVRSGAFGLLVVDVGPRRVVPAALSRLLGLAKKHGTAIVFLTDKPRRAPSLGSLISLRGHATRRRTGPDEFLCGLHALKDKRRAPGWTHEEVCGGPAGLH